MWPWIVLGLLALLFLAYCLIPSYWARNLSSRVLRSSITPDKLIALTFDDGPDPRYTPRLLDILHSSRIPATFFLVGRKAEAHPDLVQRILEDGHDIGCHSFRHHHAWLMTPWTSFSDMTATYHTLKNVSGQAPCWYRPPWGTFNLFSMLAARRFHLTPVYWSIEAQDWDKHTTPEHIQQVILEKAQPGSIVVLHDSGGAPGAPERTLAALPLVISTLKQEGFVFVKLNEMKGADK